MRCGITQVIRTIVQPVSIYVVNSATCRTFANPSFCDKPMNFVIFSVYTNYVISFRIDMPGTNIILPDYLARTATFRAMNNAFVRNFYV